MLREILNVTGKPGLYKLISQGKGTLIVEDLTDGRRFPVHARDKVVSLGDIAMYTESGDTPLGVILDKVYAKHEGQPIDVKAMDGAALRDSFAAIVEDFDRDRVHNSDIKKLFSWYNLLLSAGFTKFADETEETEASEEKAAEEA
ncbi:MAG: DUF5606 domain-containing protein [Bacteroidales bacterium]|nr:DUF5606 domain-containing protein [Bacteroidales bacterium]MDE6230682.1 DUF5606 domain-containing protein [Muribaculaceae bacterium]